MKFIMPSLNISFERWKWNDECKLYVSNQGHFKDACKRPIRCKVKSNYFYVKVDNKWIGAHRIVMLTWKPNHNADNLTVDHLNSNTRDNRLSNLEWVTREENTKRGNENTFNTADVVFTSSPCVNVEPCGIELPKNKPLTFANMGIEPQIHTAQWSTILSMIKNNKIVFRIEGEDYTAWQYQHKYRPDIATNVDKFLRKSAAAAAREELFHGNKIELVRVRG